MVVFFFLLIKELQSSLAARSGEVSTVVFDIQAFISERAQDLAPEQSRQLLGQLQQLQTAFHRASGQAQAWAGALSAQSEREEKWQKERAKEEEMDREKRSAEEREVCKEMLQNALQIRTMKLCHAFFQVIYNIQLEHLCVCKKPPS